MKAWKKLEEFVSDYLASLGWVRKKKKSYGHSIHDTEGQGYKGECKHYKAHKIHTIKNITDAKYHDDVIIFTKVKRTHYEPSNVFVTLSLINFKILLECKRIAEKMPKKIIKDKKDLVGEINYKFQIIKKNLQDINKIFKKMEKE